ncbi:MAG: aminoacyl-tRNA deacylase [Rhodocyclaceae bacterium]|nr:aminoacyl-tRNA deacylase [Rhodocyclaceae bacterium]
MRKSARSHAPETPATRLLRELGIAFSAHFYDYEDHGGTRVAALQLGIVEHQVIKTLIMEDEHREPLVVLMHGDRTVSTKALARQIPCKTVAPCAPNTASRHSGYLVGGTSPFATRKSMPVFVEKSILGQPMIFINGGRRGMLLQIAATVVVDVLRPKIVECGIEG